MWQFYHLQIVLQSFTGENFTFEQETETTYLENVPDKNVLLVQLEMDYRNAFDCSSLQQDFC